MYVGAHVSTRGGYSGAAKTALAMGAKAFQYFPMNPRSLSTKIVNVREAALCAEFCREHDMLSIGHAPYPLNPAANAAERDLMVSLIKNGLEITEACGSVGLVVHFGKYVGKDPLQGYKNIIQCLNSATQGYEGASFILLENQAGEGSQLGLTLEEMAQVRKLCQRPEKIGFCLDTCHAFASGLWTSHGWGELEARGEMLDYFPHLKAVHLNDSLHPYGSRRDRHANIGTGYIGLDNFGQMLSSAFLRHIPVVLETGKGSNGTHSEEIALVKTLFSNAD
ncbi:MULTISPECIES: deoxyribonuclease IV [Paenibacillus]|uniref:Deoxyribonuclease IV n=1 Tax=Paenibacillus violae TaxID=3077234 RepID=A0ABU3R7G3_9BACL|nr:MULTISPECIES: deoxyribonuclease IV [Paenibacillus]MDU0200213.1 deoxyribonuclease IV [Paenibacillus sp. PFR10]MEC0270154.1 deoxyribonuclease IV [Paenibacillus anseongense]